MTAMSAVGTTQDTWCRLDGDVIAPCLGDHDIIARFDAVCARAPDAIALEPGGMTYAVLQAHSVALARDLKAAGVTQGMPVGLRAVMSQAHVLGLLGILRAGGTYVPLDAHAPDSHVAGVATQAGCALVLATEPLSTPPGLTVLPLRVNAALPDQTRDAWRAQPATTACILFTSGSTGVPKGVPITARAILTRLSWWARQFPMDAGDQFLSQLSAHTLGGTLAPLSALLQGGSVHLLDRAALIAVQTGPVTQRRLAVTDVFTMPSLAEQMLLNGVSMPRLKRLALVGEHCSDALLRRIFQGFPGVQILSLYGLTECAGHAVAHLYRGDEQSAVMGRPTDNLSAWVLDESLRPVTEGTAGLLYLSGAGLTDRYSDPDLPPPVTHDPVTGTALMPTHDWVRIDAAGALRYVGRKDRQVKIRGFRVDLNHVENMLTALEPVRRAAVVAIEGRLVAVVVPEEARGVSARTLRPMIAAAVPDWAVPARLILRDALPMTVTHKIDYRALRATLDAPQRTDVEGEADTVLQAYRAVLAAPDIGPDECFFDAGGSSLDAVRLVLELEHLGLTPQMLGTHRTARGVSRALADRAATEPAPVDSTLTAGARVPMGCFAQLLMGFGYASKLPGWAVRLAIPVLQRRFFLAILERTITLPEALCRSTGPLPERVRALGARYPILRARTVRQNGHWAPWFEISGDPVQLLTCASDDWAQTRAELRARISRMTGPLVYFVQVGGAVHLLAHHAISDLRMLDSLATDLLHDGAPRAKAGIDAFEAWRAQQPALLAVPQITERLVLPAKPVARFMPPVSRRRPIRFWLPRGAVAGGHPAHLRATVYQAWLAALNTRHGVSEMTFHEVLDMRSLPEVPERFAATVGSMVGLCRTRLQRPSGLDPQAEVADLARQLDQQQRLETIWGAASWQTVRCLEQSWVFNFFPDKTAQGDQWHDRLHPGETGVMQRQRSIECNVRLHAAGQEMELIFDQRHHSPNTISDFVEGFRLHFAGATQKPGAG